MEIYPSSAAQDGPPKSAPCESYLHPTAGSGRPHLSPPSLLGIRAHGPVCERTRVSPRPETAALSQGDRRPPSSRGLGAPPAAWRDRLSGVSLEPAAPPPLPPFPRRGNPRIKRQTPSLRLQVEVLRFLFLPVHFRVCTLSELKQFLSHLCGPRGAWTHDARRGAACTTDAAPGAPAS